MSELFNAKMDCPTGCKEKRSMSTSIFSCSHQKTLGLTRHLLLPGNSALEFHQPDVQNHTVLSLQHDYELTQFLSFSHPVPQLLGFFSRTRRGKLTDLQREHLGPFISTHGEKKISKINRLPLNRLYFTQFCPGLYLS